MRRRPLLPLLLLLALLRDHGLLAASGEADYTLDDSFWNEESPVGEVERLLREYRQNQELVRNIGAHYYQIIYPVQLRHHEKMGISTREVNTQKGRGYDYQQGTRSRARTGKHFHRTSLLIKAFNHKFRLDLELNTQLLAPNLKQTQYLANGAESDIRTEIEHCYYHGTVKDYPGASAAFHTCNGVSGVIHIGNETFVIHPFYGGDLSQKHPHVIFEARTKANKGCANKLEYRPKNRRTKHVSFIEQPLGDDPGTIDSSKSKSEHSWRWWQDAGLRALNRRRRDVRETTKYIETALVIDKAMFDRRNGSTRAEVVHDAIQVANIADLYFRTLNTRVSLVYIESWQSANQADIDRKQDITRAIHKFSDYTARKLFNIDKDTTQLLTGLTFPGGESGISVPDTLCTPKSVGISVDTNTYEPHLLAGTMAHMIGHNIGMGHDDGREQCFCRDWHGCIMAQSIVGSDNVQPYKFSDCSKTDYINELRLGSGLCLLNKPNELVVHHQCGNGKLDEGEECDCGTINECQNTNPCCDPFTCRLTKEAQCASGECCERCQLKPRGVVCRDASNECDLEETCTGVSGTCPPDAHRKNGEPCEDNKGYCFAGQCPTLTLQCERIWGTGSQGADRECFEQFNSKGAVTGHCGKDNNGNYIKCDMENVKCGSLQCQQGNKYPIVTGMDEYFTRTVINIKSTEYECKATTGLPKHSEIAPMGLVRDGTPCGENLVCVNQTCTSLYPFTDRTLCPVDHNNHECSGRGACSNMNKCVCHRGWTGPDCSQHDVLPPSPTPYVPDNSTRAAYNMTKKETPYGEHEGNKMSTMNMVILLLAVVLSVFVGFAWMAYCFRKKSTSRKYDPPYVKKPIAKSFAGGSTTSNNSQEDISLDGGKIHSFNNTFSRGDSQRVIFKHGNHMAGAGSTSRYPEHKQMKRVHSGSEDEPTNSGEEEIAFIDIPTNSMAKLPEKGILKKHGYGAVDGKDKWGDDSQSEQLEAGSQSDGQEPSGAVADMEYKFKDLNGYHENIIVALKTAAAQRASAGAAVGSGDLRALQYGLPSPPEHQDYNTELQADTFFDLKELAESLRHGIPSLTPELRRFFDKYGLPSPPEHREYNTELQAESDCEMKKFPVTRKHTIPSLTPKKQKRRFFDKYGLCSPPEHQHYNRELEIETDFEMKEFPERLEHAIKTNTPKQRHFLDKYGLPSPSEQQDYYRELQATVSELKKFSESLEHAIPSSRTTKTTKSPKRRFFDKYGLCSPPEHEDYNRELGAETDFEMKEFPERLEHTIPSSRSTRTNTPEKRRFLDKYGLRSPPIHQDYNRELQAETVFETKEFRESVEHAIPCSHHSKTITPVKRCFLDKVHHSPSSHEYGLPSSPEHREYTRKLRAETISDLKELLENLKHGFPNLTPEQRCFFDKEFEYKRERERERERAPSAEKIHEGERLQGDEDEEAPPICAPIRIRNLEDLIRQLEHHSSRHMSPSGSEDIRMSETEADRHYRIDPNDLPQPPRCRGRLGGGPLGQGVSVGDEDPRFGYGRFRGGGGRLHGPMFPGAVPPPGAPGHPRHPDDDALYETADPERLRDAPDSESDEFIQAQQQLARWASEEAVMRGGGGAVQREYFPSPASSVSDATMRAQPAPPEYKH